MSDRPSFPPTASTGGDLGITQLEVAGHSYPTENGVAGKGYVSRLGRVLRAAVTNRAVSGSKADDYNDVGKGGWTTAMSGVTRARTVAPWMPASQLAILHHGINDLVVYDRLPYLREILRSMVARWRCSAIFDDRHASVVVTGGTPQAGPYSAGTLMQINGGQVTITVPADFDGSPIVLGWIMAADGVAWAAGGVYTVKVDGQVVLATDYRHTNPNTFDQDIPVVQRLVGLAPGAHTILVQFSSLTGGASAATFFDYWGIEGPEAPMVLLVKEWLRGPLSLAALNAGATVAITDARTVAFNAMLDGLAAEFTDSRVRTVDVAQLDHRDDLLQADHDHPTEAGHLIIARQCLAALQAAPAYSALDALAL